MGPGQPRRVSGSSGAQVGARSLSRPGTQRFRDSGTVAGVRDISRPSVVPLPPSTPLLSVLSLLPLLPWPRPLRVCLGLPLQRRQVPEGAGMWVLEVLPGQGVAEPEEDPGGVAGGLLVRVLLPGVARVQVQFRVLRLRVPVLLRPLLPVLRQEVPLGEGSGGTDAGGRRRAGQ